MFLWNSLSIVKWRKGCNLFHATYLGIICESRFFGLCHRKLRRFGPGRSDSGLRFLRQQIQIWRWGAGKERRICPPAIAGRAGNKQAASTMPTKLLLTGDNTITDG